MAALKNAIGGAVVLIVFMVTMANTSRNYKCGTKPADIVFLLDSSGSIWERDFPKQLRFVEGVVDMFDISAEQIRIGAVSFSNWAFVDFQLNKHKSEDDVRRAIRNIAHIRGDTNTASALRYMRTVMFTEKNGARSNVPHIAIIITDGKSNNPQITQMEAAKAQAQGIHLFAIGVGNSTDNSELYSLASDPDDHYVFTVEDYTALLYIEDLVAIKTCKVIDESSTIFTSTTPPLPEPVCGDSAFADIVFATSPVAAAKSTRRSMAFFKKVARGLNIADGKVHIGMVPKECDAVDAVDLKEAEQKQNAVLDELDTILANQQSTASVLRYMREASFTESNGARQKAKRIGVIIVDEAEGSLAEAKRHARTARNDGEIELFIIGVGRKINRKDLYALATRPVKKHVFLVRSYKALGGWIAKKVQHAICPPPSH